MRHPSDRGSATVETVILVPVLMALVMFIIHVHRMSDASFRVARAADVGARVASMSRSESMRSNGIAAARADITSGSTACATHGVSAERTSAGRLTMVTVTVWCRVDIRGLGLLGVRASRLVHSSTEVVDFYTGR
jgi:Flp pilus assembly protein TadG